MITRKGLVWVFVTLLTLQVLIPPWRIVVPDFSGFERSWVAYRPIFSSPAAELAGPGQVFNRPRAEIAAGRLILQLGATAGLWWAATTVVARREKAAEGMPAA